MAETRAHCSAADILRRSAFCLAPMVGAVHPRARTQALRRRDIRDGSGRAVNRRARRPRISAKTKTSASTTNFTPRGRAKPVAWDSPSGGMSGRQTAWRAIHPLSPAKDSFPYTIRVVRSHRIERFVRRWPRCAAPRCVDGAGGRLPRSVEGIAMGLVKEPEGFGLALETSRRMRSSRRHGFPKSPAPSRAHRTCQMEHKE